MGMSIDPSYFPQRRAKKKSKLSFKSWPRVKKKTKSLLLNSKMKLQLLFLATVALMISSQMTCEAASIHGSDLADEEVFIVRRYGSARPGDACSSSSDCYVGFCSRGICKVSGPGR